MQLWVLGLCMVILGRFLGPLAVCCGIEVARVREWEMQGTQNVEMSLAKEIRGLRAALQLARRRLKTGEEDLLKVGTVVARLTDSVGRAMLAQSKLVAEGDGTVRMRSETDRLLRDLGLGEL